MLPCRGGDFPEGFMAQTTPFLLRAIALAVPLTLLAACDSSQRFGGYGAGGSLARTAPASPPPPLTAAPSIDDADTQTLPPPPGVGRCCRDSAAFAAALSEPHHRPSARTRHAACPGARWCRDRAGQSAACCDGPHRSLCARCRSQPHKRDRQLVPDGIRRKSLPDHAFQRSQARSLWRGHEWLPGDRTPEGERLGAERIGSDPL